MRALGFADLVNPAGRRVSPSLAAINSAVEDFAAPPDANQFVLGKSMLHIL